jgi:tRNA dimethylallyltransferase
MTNNKPVVLLMGPTAAGKTDIAVQLAEQGNFEIISVDSALVYREMNIGTAKPDAETLERAPHFLIDIRDPAQAYSAAEFVSDAGQLITEIHDRGNTPLLCGGTMLYFRAITEGLSELPKADEEIRQALIDEASDIGWAAMHAQLMSIDPEAANRIHPNDPQRIQRALEIFRITGQRFDQMLAQGFVEEVEKLRLRPDLNLNKPSMRSVGYRQIWQYLDGEFELEKARLKAIVATRQLAKRQFTWLRAVQDAQWTDTLNSSDITRLIGDISSKA